MDDLKMIFQLMNDTWKFLKKYQGIKLTDMVCDGIRREQEEIVGKYETSENVCKLAGELLAAALGYLYRYDKR